MRLFLFVFFMCLLSLNLSAQIGHGGEPFDWAAKSSYEMDPEKIAVPSLESYRAEDEINDRLNGVPYRYGVNIEVDFDIHNSGKWIDTPEGDRVWRLGLKLDGAQSINFVFDEFDISEGGKVFVYTPDKSILLGSFTTENRSQYGSLGVGLIHSTEILIEYHEPANEIGEGYLHINNVTYGYRNALGGLPKDAKGAFGNSGACNINVNCPEGALFDIQKRSVALIVVNDNAICSGAMINNVAQDGTPFFLTANHCVPSNPGSVGNWVFYFNYESATCNGNDGPINQSVSGATLLARNQESDFALLELDDIPPVSFEVCYSGWDASDLAQNTSSAFSIHHPSGDVKKICFEDDSPYKESLGTFLVNQTWYIDQWELGVTEPGSSGSPLFNQNGLIIGQLAGGQAACIGNENNGLHDFYGRLGVSWNFGATPSTALSFWLDPQQTGITIVPNSCTSSQPPNNAVLGALQGIEDIICEISPLTPALNVFNGGNNIITSLELEVNINGESEIIEWQGEIEVSAVALIELESFIPEAGSNSLEVEVVSVNGQTDTVELGNKINREFTTFGNTKEIVLNLLLDNWPGETTWEITGSDGIAIYSGGPYSEDGAMINENFCLPAGACYTFTIFDDADDGICCSFGQGSYEVLDEDGEVLASGGEFDGAESTEFCFALENEAVLGPITGIPRFLCDDASSISPLISVANGGDNVITSMELEVVFNSESQILNVTGDLGISDTAVIVMGEFTPVTGENIIEVLVSSVNDIIVSNPDTVSTLFSVDTDAPRFDLRIAFDEFPSETSWEITDSNEEVVYSGGPYQNNTDSLNRDFCLLSGECYDFTIFDSGANGICCQFGNGFYEILNDSSNVVVSGGEFNNSETQEICIEKINDLPEGTVIFPNPATTQFSISSTTNQFERYELFDIQGRIIDERNLNESSFFTIQINSLQTGVYILHLHSEDETIRRKVIIED